MKPASTLKRDLLLASGWCTSRVRRCLRTQDGSGLIEFIRQRHTERFFEPIQLLGSAAKNDQGYGFAMMALCSLLVETIQSYRDGLPTTYGGELKRLKNLKSVPKTYQIPAGLQVNGKKAFRRFFRSFRTEFDGLSGAQFYQNVRNGLLHQAQTKGGWKIGKRKASLCLAKTIDRDIFATRLKVAFDKYLSELDNSDWDSNLWKHARRKIWWLIRLS